MKETYKRSVINAEKQYESENGIIEKRRHQLAGESLGVAMWLSENIGARNSVMALASAAKRMWRKSAIMKAIMK
jgi:hypothetical protein